MAPKKARGAKRNSKKRAASVACTLDEAPLITSDVKSQDDTAESPGTAETDLIRKMTCKRQTIKKIYAFYICIWKSSRHKSGFCRQRSG